MKTREDFVSNSSSSSYVVAVDFDKYDFDLFVSRVCDTCCGGRRRGDRKTRLANEALLRGCATMEALYVGVPVVGKIKEIWRRGENYDHTFVKPGDSDDFTPFRELSEGCYWRGKGERVTMIGADALEYEYDDVLPAWMPVPRETMSSIRRYDGWDVLPRGLKGNTAKARAARIMTYVKQKKAEVIRRPEPEVFCVTRNSIANTRDLVKAGYKVGWFGGDEKLVDALDRLEARVKSGETIVYAVAGDSGEGVHDTRLYMPHGYSNPFADTPAQPVTDLYD